MPTPVYMPKFEMSQETGTVMAWLKAEGEFVKKGEPLLEVETDKATMEVEAPATGILAAVTASPGQVVPIATPIAYILKPGESLDSSSEMPETAAEPSLPKESGASTSGLATGNSGHKKATPVAARLAEGHGLDLTKIVGTGPGGRITKEDVEAAIAADQSATAQGGKVRAVPAARRLARELGIDLGTVPGTGPEGRIQSADVMGAVKAQQLAQETARTADLATFRTPAEQPVTSQAPQVVGNIAVRQVVPLTNIRRTIAERMTASVREAPQFTVTVDADMGRAIEMVQDLKVAASDGNPKVTLTALMVKACAWALRQHPEVNASFQGDSVVEWDEVNVGVATAIDQGLIVPVVRGADELGLRGIAEQLAGLAGRAREGKPKFDDLQGGTFTVSNLGMFGIDRFTAILNPPQAAILAVGRVAKRVEVREDDEIEIRPMASLALTADHRVLDGATAARFLATVQRALEHPGLLLE
ncbi:MAG: 2-oxo acid dehydrogenase subunit E2 [Armatimonadetes bacterium]|nr:2-oxo acid dehydrogenase subunit E2 [Armatimonadota bacterium]